MIVLTLTRPWLLVGYRALGRERASGGLVRGIGEAVTQASAGAAFGRPGRADGRGAGPKARPTRAVIVGQSARIEPRAPTWAGSASLFTHSICTQSQRAYTHVRLAEAY